MTNMIEVKTAELSGAALDWAVAQAADVQFFQMGANWPGNSAVNEAARLGPVVIMDLVGKLRLGAGSCFVAWSPSTDWSQGGPLIHKHAIEVEPADRYAEFGNQWGATMIGRKSDVCWAGGDTPLVAACRVLVLGSLGIVVSVPRELLP